MALAPGDIACASGYGGTSWPICENDHGDDPIAARNGGVQAPIPDRKR